MKFNKKIALLATVVATSALLSACSTGTVGENVPKVSANPVTEKYTFKDDEKTYKLVYSDPWRIISADEGYDITIIPNENNENPDIRLSIKSEKTNNENATVEEVANAYSQELETGIVSTTDFTIGEDKGLWLSYATIDESDYDIGGLEGKSDEVEENVEIGCIVKNGNAYVFKLAAKDKATLDNYKEQMLSVLQGIKFL